MPFPTHVNKGTFHIHPLLGDHTTTLACHLHKIPTLCSKRSTKYNAHEAALKKRKGGKGLSYPPCNLRALLRTFKKMAMQRSHDCF